MSQHSDRLMTVFLPKNMSWFSSRLAVAAIALLGLSACVTPYPQGSVSTLTLSEARDAPPAVPEAVRWGGTIVSIENKADGTSSLEIVSRPLGYAGRPVRNDQSDGRFFAEIDDVVDPSIVKAGRDITVTGLVGEVRVGTIGESPYRFPVVAVDDYHYWSPASARTYTGGFPCRYRHSYRGDRYYGPCGFEPLHNLHGGVSLYGHRGPRGHRGHRGHGGRVGFSLIIRP